MKIQRAVLTLHWCGSWSPPRSVPNSVNGWWCDEKHEYAFLGFSYSVAACQSVEQLKSDFRDIRSRFQGRYVRLYGTCDRYGFYNDVIEAAWTAGLGIHALIWFGFTGGNEWMRRRDELFRVLHSNAKARFVTRAVQFGSEPLFDRVIDPYWLADEVNRAKWNVGQMGIKVTVSDLAYSYQREWNKGARHVLDNVDVVDAHMLPYFSPQATTARNSWPLIMQDLNWFMKNSNGKKIYLSENGWPSSTSSNIQPNSANAVANVRNEHDYYTLLDQHCSEFKRMTGGGVGWFAHIYSDSQEGGYGVYNQEGGLKFPFRPRTEC
ncbi:glycoside hydrolase family 17 protein [Amanita muscaria Koide BX008]|uniref:glucan endo-1,3-beta-D-glucosidase n=1 Tax=Amanita muscaria (strain Koide BX008) TaxID=946122 RepID=A0A0C2SQX5_AMAMK|nr:glycoside hydrolase family 17 protein [Amanita muscaria Koide BX008]